MIITDVSTLNLSSYKRLFTFGCSFTGYMWPTWADILHKEMPKNTEHYNFGKSGGGQLFILSMLSEASQKFNFTKDDLIVIQWSTFFREDRYIKRCWQTPGNIFTQSMYDDNFIRYFTDLRGYIIRDLALMTAARYMLTALPSSSIMLSSIPINGELINIEPNTKIDDVLELYKDTISLIQKPMTEVLRPPNNDSIFPWDSDIEYYDPVNDNPKKLFRDYHPGPVLYYEYLQKLKFPVTDIGKKYATESENHVHTLQTRQEIGAWHNHDNSQHIIL
jgi:hypothetical protein